MTPSILNKSETRPEWVRPAFNKAVENFRKGSPGFAPWTEFAPLDDSSYVVEFVRTGSRGKDRFLLLFRRGGEVEQIV